MAGLSAVVSLDGFVTAFAKQDESSRPNELYKVPREVQADERLTEENFSRNLYSDFIVYTTPLTGARLQLVTVINSDSDSKTIESKHVKRASFSVLFRGPRNKPAGIKAVPRRS